MNVFAATTLVAGALTAAILGLAGTASADTAHNQWVNQMSSHSSVVVPHVDNSAHG
jgi:uncharacterized membrane protein YoaK (UPF0700 family)